MSDQAAFIDLSCVHLTAHGFARWLQRMGGGTKYLNKSEKVLRQKLKNSIPLGKNERGEQYLVHGRVVFIKHGHLVTAIKPTIQQRAYAYSRKPIPIHLHFEPKRLNDIEPDLIVKIKDYLFPERAPHTL